MRGITVLVLSLVAAPLHASAADLSEVARIGGADTDPRYLFGRIGYVCIAGDGSVFVADLQLEQIRRYNATGEYLADVGRVGEGPGEYRGIQGVLALPTGYLAVLSNPSRLTFFDIATHAYARDIRVPSSLHTSEMLAYDDSGNVYVKDVDGVPEPGRPWRFLWLKLAASGAAADRIPIPAGAPDAEPFSLMFPEGARTNFVIETVSAWSPRGYMVTGRNDRYAFDIQRPGAALRVERESSRVALGREERAEWEAWARVFGERAGQSFHIPETKPAFRGIYVDADGRIRVLRYVAARQVELPPRAPGDERPLSTWREPNTFDVFEPDGTFLGTVELPVLVRVAAWRGDSLWGVESTDEGEQLIHWRVRWKP